MKKCALTLLSAAAASALILFGYIDQGWAGLSISPAFLEVNLDHGAPSGQFLVANTGDEVERYRVKMVFFTFTPEGGFRELPDDEHSLAPLIKFNPKEFAIPPKSRQSVRFFIPAGHAKQKNGEYWAAMQLESLKTAEARSSDGKGRNFRFQVITNIVVPIFAVRGDVRYAGTLREMRLVNRGTQSSVEAVVANTGQGHLFVIGEYEVVGESGAVAAQGSLSRAYVMPGTERLMRADLNKQLPPGKYTMRIKYSCSHLPEPITGETQVVSDPKS